MRTWLLFFILLSGFSVHAEIPPENLMSIPSSIVETLPENLIPNPGFESARKCPKGLGQIELVDDWNSPNGGTPDYFNICYTRDARTVGIPNNFFSHQRLIEGDAYAGIYAGEQEIEYLQVKLLAPLEAGKRYCLRFFASPPSDKGYQLQAMKVLFREKAHSQSDWGPIDDQSQALAPEFTPARNSADWTLMSSSYVASGGEEYLLVGYFGNLNGKGYTFLDDFGLYAYDSPEGCKKEYFSGDPLQDVYNYIPNPGFEMKYSCPEAREEMNKCVGWRVLENTPDFFHRCGRGTAGVPNNEVGSQEPHSGEAYSGFWCYLPKNGDYREFISMKLKDPLKRGKAYCLSMWVSLSDISVGALYDLQMLPARSVDRIPSEVPSDDPRLVFLTYQNQLLNDRKEWTKVSALFMANGGEQVLTIGNYRKNDDSKMVLERESVAPHGHFQEACYYYVDDVSLTAINSPISECADGISLQIIADADNPNLFLNKRPGDELPDPVLVVMDTIPVVDWKAGDTLVLEHFLFAFDEAELASEALPLLDTLAAHLERNPELVIDITGHTDDQGAETYNLKLSQARAGSVSTYLAQKGIKASRVYANGRGEESPIFPNDSEDNRARNRRVEIKFLEKKK